MKDTGEQTRRLARQQNAGALNNTPTPPGPTVWSGSYSYVTPPTAVPPNMGEIVHGNNLLSQMLFSKTDLGSTGYSGAPLAIGDVLDINGVRYTIDAVPRDMGDYYSVYIEPETQLQPAVYGVTVYAANIEGAGAVPIVQPPVVQPPVVQPPATPTNTSPPVISGAPTNGETLTCDPGVWVGADSYEYAWRYNGQYIPGADQSAWVVAAPPGYTITCDVTGIKGAATAVASSNALVVA